MQDDAMYSDHFTWRLLAWYDQHARRLPWRAPPGIPPDPYRVWLSEVMLQQTTVAAVGPYFTNFLASWPTVHHLAQAPLEEVLAAWAGLGYYARARNLHACAQVVSRLGRFPETEAELRGLPGIGRYTAAAMAAIAFDRKTSPVDGNVERVVCRVFAVQEPMPAAKGRLHRLAQTLTPETRPGDFAQAMMDLGATVCLARRPRCLVCPVVSLCSARAKGIAEALPRQSSKPVRPTRRAIAFWTVAPSGAVLLRRRPERGLLASMMEVPSTEWRNAAWHPGEVVPHAPVEADWRPLAGAVRHTFTHFHLEVEVWAGRAPREASCDHGRWVPLDRLADQGLPTVMRKIVHHALAGLAAL